MKASDPGRALGWGLANTLLGRLGTLGIGIVLARLLGPAEFGAYAVALVVLMAVLSFNELGVSLAIVRWPGDPVAIAPTVATLSTACSAVLAGALALAAPWIAAAMGAPDAVGVIRVLGLTVVVSGLVATPAALLQREFRQDVRMLVDQVNVWLGALVSIGLALLGWGAMSLAVGRLVGAGVSAVLMLALSPVPFRLGFDRVEGRRLLAFGLPLAGASICMFAVGYADQLLVGALLGPSALGFYVLAFNLSNWPVTVMSLPMRSVAPAVFARLQHDPEQMRRRFLVILGLITLVAVPGCASLSGVAEPLVRLVYGREWAPAATVLVWLAALAALKILIEYGYDYLVVAGRSVGVLRIQLITLVALVPAVWIGARTGGIAGAAAAQVAVTGLVLLPLYGIDVVRTGVRARAVLTRLVVPVVAGALTWALIRWVGTWPGPDGLVLIASLAVVGAIVGVLVLRRRADLTVLRGLPAAPDPAATAPVGGPA
jgi:O-antigen/teichoic acid export membrane protein